MRLLSPLSLAAPIVALAMLVSTSNASAQLTETVQNGHTTLTFASGLIPALNGAGITLGAVSPSTLTNGVVGFTVVGGAVDLDTGAGQVIHSGGLTITAGTAVVTVQSFIVDTTTGMPVMTGLVSINGVLLGRLPVFDLTLTTFIPPLTPNRFGQVTVTGVNVALDSTIAAILNSTFNMPAFAGGSVVGTATVVVTVHS
jgi:hypothetical protein